MGHEPAPQKNNLSIQPPRPRAQGRNLPVAFSGLDVARSRRETLSSVTFPSARSRSQKASRGKPRGYSRVQILTIPSTKR